MRSLVLTATTVIGLAARPADAARPQAIDDLGIQLEDSTRVRLNWSPVAHDVEGHALPCAVYHVHHGTEADFIESELTRVASVTAPTLLHEPEGVTGFYRVRVETCPSGVPDGMVLVPAGGFTMGQEPFAMPEHEVVLSRSFLLGETEVTNAQYVEALNWALAGGLVSVEGDVVRQHGEDLLWLDSGSDINEILYDPESQRFVLHAGTFFAIWGGPGWAYPDGYDPAIHPAIWVTWFGAACYCDWRSQMEGLAPYYGGRWDQVPVPADPYDAEGYRLPTEAEWEYAAQYDDERSFPWGEEAPNCLLANHATSMLNRCVGWTAPVGAHPAGAGGLGLQDLAGNVNEWCNDWYAAYAGEAELDPVGPASGANRVTRGGGWVFEVVGLQLATRVSGPPDTRNFVLGFRVCRTLP